MAGEKQDGPARMEVAVADPTVTHAGPGGDAHETIAEATEVDLSGGLGPDETEDEAAEQEAGEQTSKELDADDEAAEGDLPDYDGANEEVRAAYDKKFFNEEGTVNLPALSGEFFKNLEKGEGKLNEGTYAYLKDTLGLTREAVQEIERGQMALREASTAAFYGRIEGGKEGYEKAVQWAIAGGYTDAQKAAYNKAQSAGGVGFEDAVDALMARYAKANGGAAQGGRRGPPGRRASTPQRDVTSGARAGGPGDGPKLTQAEYGKQWSAALSAVSEARRSGDRAAVRKAEEARDALRRQARRQGLA